LRKDALLGLLALVVGTPVQAELIDRGRGLIYDDVLDITWLQDANYAKTSGFDADGLMFWGEAVAWADGLVYEGVDDWRLPKTPQEDPTCSSGSPGGGLPGYYGFGCTGSEMGHLYNVTGISSSAPGPFLNVWISWSGTEHIRFKPPPYPFAFFFKFDNGLQNWRLKNDNLFGAWAVRDGDIACARPDLDWLGDPSCPLPDLSIGDASVTEGDSGTTEAEFQLLLSEASPSVVRVPFSTSGGTATEGQDYLSASGELTIPAGAIDTSIRITVLGDHLFEQDETFLVELGSPIGANPMNSSGTGTIFNDDNPGLSIRDVTVAEPESGSTSATFTVELSRASSGIVTVDYTTMDGLATVAEGDYTLTSGMLTFDPGVTSQSIDVPVLADAVPEQQEDFTVELSAASGAAIAHAQATGTIFDRGFYPLDPCRIIDTRLPVSQLGGPALVAGADRAFHVGGTCGIPASAKAISLNIAVTTPTGPGNVRLHPAGTPVPPTSSINYSAGQTRSNNAVVPLNALGQIAAFVSGGSGTVHLILDVNGYFQ
jgi:hypothetical protein